MVGTKKRRNMPYLKIIAKDLLAIRNKINPQNREPHLNHAIAWIKNAQDANSDGGVAAYYDLFSGWGPSYPEVTGYLIPTLLDTLKINKDEDLLKRIFKMGEWLLEIQLVDGAYQGGMIGDEIKPSVFNTAQVIDGLLELYRFNNDRTYLEAVRKACDWLVNNQEPEGYWRKNTYQGIVRTYDARVALIMVKAGKLCNCQQYIESGERNLNWVLTQRNSSGWFNNCDNSVKYNHAPLMHTLSYTLEGLLGSGIILNNPEYIELARKTLERLLKKFEINLYLVARYDSKWKPVVRYICLTGCAQISLCWFMLTKFFGGLRYANAGMKMNDFLCTQQDIRSSIKGINGAIKGSTPIWGSYQRFKYLSWATKYFIDSLVYEQRIIKNIEKDSRI